MQNVHISVPASLTYSAFLRHLSNDLLVLAGFNKGWCGRLKIVVDELFMNAVRYGSDDQSTVFLAFAYDDHNFTFTIEDEGKGTKSVSVDDLQKIIEKNGKDGNLSRTSGRGLAMITKWWTDDMAIESSEHGGILVRFSKTIDDAEPAVGLPLAGSIVPDFSIGDPVPRQEPAHVVALSGEIDSSTIDEKTASVTAAIDELKDGETLLLDCKELAYISSIFVGNLASWQTSVKHKKAHLTLRSVQPAVREVLDLVGLAKLLTIEP